RLDTGRRAVLMMDDGEQIERTGERLAHVHDLPHGIRADLRRRRRRRVTRVDGDRARDLSVLRAEVQLARGHAGLERLTRRDVPTGVLAIRLDEYGCGEEDVDDVRVAKPADLVVAHYRRRGRRTVGELLRELRIP